MVNCGTGRFHLAGAQIPLEISGIVIGIPQTPLYIGEERDVFVFGRFVGQSDLADFTVVIHRNKGQHGSLQIVFGAGKTAVTETVAAFVAVQFGLCGLPARIPYTAAVFDIEVFAVDIGRNVVVAVSGQTQQLCILIKSITAAGVGNQ